MKSTLLSKTIGVYGPNWSNQTKKFIETVGLCGKSISLFQYDCRESLFIDQYDIFIITDFGKGYSESWDKKWLEELEILRQIIYSRSMRSVIFANDDDIDVSKSLREAGARVVKVCPKGRSVPKAFADAIICEYFGPKRPPVSAFARNSEEQNLVEIAA